MAEDALRALAVSVRGHGSAERSLSGSQPLKGSPQAPPGVLCGSQQQVGRDRPCPPFPFHSSAIAHLLPKPAGRQQRALNGEPPALLPHSPSLPGPREGAVGAANNSTHRDTARGVHWHLELLLQAGGDQGGLPGGQNLSQDSRLHITAPDSSSTRQVQDALGPQWLGHGCVQPHPSHTYLCAEVRSRAGQSSQQPTRLGDYKRGFFCLSLAMITEAIGKPRWGTH